MFTYEHYMLIKSMNNCDILQMPNTVLNKKYIPEKKFYTYIHVQYSPKMVAK